MNKIAVITGATGGMGKAITAALQPDHDIIEVSRTGAIPYDLSDIHAPLPTALSQLDSVDVLIHAAATGVRRSVAEATAADWQHQIQPQCHRTRATDKSPLTGTEEGKRESYFH